MHIGGAIGIFETREVYMKGVGLMETELWEEKSVLFAHGELLG